MWFNVAPIRVVFATLFRRVTVRRSCAAGPLQLCLLKVVSGGRTSMHQAREDPMDAAERRVREGAERIEQQERLVSVLETAGHPFAARARQFLCKMRDQQKVWTQELLAEEQRYANSKE